MTKQVDFDTLSTGPEIDAAVASNIFGYNTKIIPNDSPMWTADLLHPFPSRAMILDGLMASAPNWEECDNWVECPAYSRSIAAAWQVVEKMRPHGQVSLTWHPEDCINAGDCDIAVYKHWEFYIEDVGMGRGDSAPLAICRAALKAVSKA